MCTRTAGHIALTNATVQRSTRKGTINAAKSHHSWTLLLGAADSVVLAIVKPGSGCVAVTGIVRFEEALVDAGLDAWSSRFVEAPSVGAAVRGVSEVVPVAFAVVFGGALVAVSAGLLGADAASAFGVVVVVVVLN